MKQCIVCGRNNVRWKIKFAGNKCEDCVQGREVVIVDTHFRGHIGGFKRCSRCRVVQNEENSCLVRGMRFNSYCRVCDGERYRERKLRVINNKI